MIIDESVFWNSNWNSPNEPNCNMIFQIDFTNSFAFYKTT